MTEFVISVCTINCIKGVKGDDSTGSSVPYNLPNIQGDILYVSTADPSAI